MFEPTLYEQVRAADEARIKKKKEAWERYKKKNKRVYFSVPISEYEKLEKKASRNGRTVARQIYAQSQAYEKAQFLPPEQIDAKINLLLLELNKIGININQIAFHTNFFNRLTHQKNLVKEFDQLELMIESFVEKPWTVPKSKK